MTEQRHPPLLEQTPWAKIGDTIAGVVLPAACFVLAWDLGPDWQSGRLTDYSEIFLSGPVTRDNCGGSRPRS